MKMRIKELRLERNLTQSEVAKAIGTSQRNIGRWENGENTPAAIYVKALAEFFCVSADYLLGLEDYFGVRVDDKEKKPDTLSAEERRLLEGYREINAAGKKLVMQTVETLRGTSAGSGSTSTQNKIG